LNSFIPAIKFSSLGAIGFARCAAFRAAAESIARCAKAFSNALGVALDRPALKDTYKKPGGCG
jgi:hypothetical protein